jgi:hypothetical protein
MFPNFLISARGGETEILYISLDKKKDNKESYCVKILKKQTNRKKRFEKKREAAEQIGGLKATRRK